MKLTVSSFFLVTNANLHLKISEFVNLIIGAEVSFNEYIKNISSSSTIIYWSSIESPIYDPIFYMKLKYNSCGDSYS